MGCGVLNTSRDLFLLRRRIATRVGKAMTVVMGASSFQTKMMVCSGALLK